MQILPHFCLKKLQNLGLPGFSILIILYFKNFSIDPVIYQGVKLVPISKHKAGLNSLHRNIQSTKATSCVLVCWFLLHCASLYLLLRLFLDLHICVFPQGELSLLAKFHLTFR